ncbi:MAG TPA: hypothetical protein VH702_21785 [Vicinamibacterales bacterium]
MKLTRRKMAGGLVLGLPVAGLLAETPAEAAQRSGASDSDYREMVRHLGDIVAFMRPYGDPATLQNIREVQRVYLRTNQKFPEYIEIGISVWEQLYDWHIRTQQALNIVRFPDGRYGMQALLSTFVLRPDAQPNYVGPGGETLQ